MATKKYQMSPPAAIKRNDPVPYQNGAAWSSWSERGETYPVNHASGCGCTRCCFVMHRAGKGRPPNPPPGARVEANILYNRCQTCERLFKPRRSDAQYCSNACRQKDYRERVRGAA